jgi:PAS domain S-box-containing protein
VTVAIARACGISYPALVVNSSIAWRRPAAGLSVARLLEWIPVGGTLPTAAWRDRHRVIVGLLWAHALGIALFALAMGYPALHSLAEGGAVAAAAALAGSSKLGRSVRAGIATWGLVLSSALLVHVSGGYVEFHFHFFVMVIVVSLYEDWVPFLMAIGFVLIEHGVVGVIQPTAVYNHPDAWANPWKWAAIHAVFVVGASAASIAAWRLNEIIRQRYHLILDSAGDGIYGVDRNGRITFANAAAARLLNRAPAELVGRDESAAVRLVQPIGPDGEAVDAPGDAALALAASHRAVGVGLQRSDGTTFQVDFVSTPVLERGELVGAVVALQDVTERTRAEQALRESEERLRRVIAGALDAVLVIDDQGHIAEWNHRAEAMFGWTKAEVLGREPVDLLVPERLREEYRQNQPELAALREGRALSRRLEIVAARRDGRELPVEVAISTLQTAQGQGFSVFLRDLTDRRLAEQQAAHLAHVDKLRALGQMASGIAHDLNQSLAIVSGFSDLVRIALDSPAPDQGKVKGMLDHVARAAIEGGETVKRLLLFARRPEDLPAETVDVHTLLADVARLTAPRWRDVAQAEGRPVTMQLEVDPTATIDGYPAELRQALTNLIFNAVDAMPRGGTLTLGARCRDGKVEISVSDSGVGMADDVKARVFEPFFSTKGDQGTGLGLAQVFGIAERHNATVEVESAVGEGTTFRLTFPAGTGAGLNGAVGPSDAEVAAQRERPTRSLDRPQRVLAVDDDPTIREMLAAGLRREGREVVTVATGEAALEQLRQAQFDVVLSDIGMGAGMNGWELAAKVRAEWPNVRVLLATGWAGDLDARKARTRGVDGVLGKPYRIAELEAVVGSN